MARAMCTPLPERPDGLEFLVMSTRPRDTSAPSWTAQREAVAAMDPSDRVRVAIDLSESVREIQIQGLVARKPGWSRADAVAWLVRRLQS
jgi:hypothetical protein